MELDKKMLDEALAIAENNQGQNDGLRSEHNNELGELENDFN